MIAQTVHRLNELETTPEALKRTRTYLYDHIRDILHPNENILICFPDKGEGSLGGLFAAVVAECGCKPIFWGPDFRWKGLLKQAFVDNIDGVFGPPLVVLGLMKMARATSTPLGIYNAFLAGYPYTNWLTEGIKRGLDCHVWGCYWIGEGPVIAGFTCDKEAGIHIRSDIFEARICDGDGRSLPDARRGAFTLHYKAEPGLVYDTRETAKIWHQPCSCGCDDARIVEISYVADDDPAKTLLEEQFLAWSSILDYRVKRTECGLNLELVVFPGENLPKITSCARLTVRPWNPDADVPFCI